MGTRAPIPEDVAARAETSVTSVGDDELPLLMVRAVKAMVADASARDEAPPATALTVMHGIAARYLERHDDVTTVELAHHLRVTKQSASEIVGALEREGYVERHPHPVDGRARVVQLTDKGSAGLVSARARWNDVVDDWGALVSPGDLACVRRCLEAYLDAHPAT